MSKDCVNCAFFQAYFIKNGDRFLRTNRGYCNKKSITTFLGNTCIGFENSEKEEVFNELTKENVSYALENICKLIELFGIKVDDNKSGVCEHNVNNLIYNDNLK